MTLTVAVGSLDGEAKQIASLIAGRLATIESPVRLKVENAGSVLDAAKAFAAGQGRSRGGARAMSAISRRPAPSPMTAHGVVMIVAPPGSSITSIAKLRDHTVGVVGGEINHGVVEALKKEYDLGRANVTFKDIAPSGCAPRGAGQGSLGAVAGGAADRPLSVVCEGPVSRERQFRAGADPDRFRRRHRRRQRPL